MRRDHYVCHGISAPQIRVAIPRVVQHLPRPLRQGAALTCFLYGDND
jgi:hypothetical protein